VRDANGHANNRQISSRPWMPGSSPGMTSLTVF